MLLENKKLVYIKALDHFSYGYHNVYTEDFEDLPKDVSYVEVVGWLVKETKDYYVLINVLTYIEFEEGDTENLNVRIAKILKRDVVEMHELKVGEGNGKQ